MSGSRTGKVPKSVRSRAVSGPSAVQAKMAITVRLDPACARQLQAVVEAETRTLTNHVETALIRDLSARDEALRAITMHAASGTPLPFGARLLDRQEAAALNQSRAFVLRLDVLAKPPMTEAWFPNIARPGGGAINVASARLRDELTGIATNLVRWWRDLLQICGGVMAAAAMDYAVSR